MSILTAFSCPKCGEKLDDDSKTLRCKNNHCFDKAASGYVNLLTADRMNSKAPGDNKIMVDARKNVLDSGIYQPLCDALALAAAQSHKNGGLLLDAGCGEGYYTCAIAQSMKKADKNAVISGVDISKTAVNAAAKRAVRESVSVDFAVASVFALPVADESCSTVVSVFAPFCGDEFRRVLEKNGAFFMVIPSAEHLWGLKKAVYDKPYENEVKSYKIDGFEFVKERRIHENVTVNGTDAIKNLFMMTPYYYKTGRNEQARLDSLTTLETEISFILLEYRKIV